MSIKPDSRRKKEYLVRRSLGWSAYVDPAPVSAHLTALREANIMDPAGGHAAGVPVETYYGIRIGRWARIESRHAERLLALDVASVIAGARPCDLIPRLGSRRRQESLTAIGWTVQDIDDHAGYHLAQAVRGRHPRISKRHHEAMVKVFRALAMTPGPSEAARARGASLGYVVPLAWGVADLDDPAAVPSMPRDQSFRSVDEVIADVVLIGDEPMHVATERLGMGRQALEAALVRAGRKDLLRRLYDNSERWRNGARDVAS